MALDNCSRCKKLFNKTTRPLCPACIEKDEREYSLVHDSLREKPNQTISELSENTGVPEKAVLRLIQEGRIASDGMPLEVTCGRCGAPAISLMTRLCAKCAARLTREAAEAAAGVAAADTKSDRKPAAVPPPKKSSSSKKKTLGSVHKAVKAKSRKSEPS